jgi:GAF domain-containing protein
MTASVHPDTPQGSAPADVLAAAVSSAPAVRSRLFSKYDALLVAVVGVTLLSGGIIEVFTHYREHRASLIRIQHEQAKAAAAKISQFIEDIEGQLGWTTQLPWSASAPESRRFDALRLLRQVPAITELVMVDSGGKERLRVSRLTMDVVDSGNDLSQDPKFTEAVAHKVYFGPVYFRRESEPYMTVALSGTRKDAGVSIAEVNLKLIWDVVSQVKAGEHGRAYVVSARGRLIAHPDMGLVLRNTDMSKLVQVQAAQADTDVMSDVFDGAQDILGQEVLTAFAPIRPLRWTMFVERPAEEAYAALYAALQRLAIVLAAALIFTMLVGMLLSRRVVGPIEALRAGAEHIGGDLADLVSIGAEPERAVEALGGPLRREMGSAEVIDIINRSASGLQAALDTLIQSAARLCNADSALIDQKAGDRLEQLASFGFAEDFAAWRKNRTIVPDRGSIVGRALLEAKLVQVLDVRADREFDELEAQERAGFRTVLAAPLMCDGAPSGVLVLTRMHPELFGETQTDLVATFANLAAILIANASLLGTLREHVKAPLQSGDPASPAS